MSITFQKRQKEMKRQEKQREKMARRAQRKLEKRDGGGPPIEYPEGSPEAMMDTPGEPEAPEAPEAQP